MDPPTLPVAPVTSTGLGNGVVRSVIVRPLPRACRIFWPTSQRRSPVLRGDDQLDHVSVGILHPALSEVGVGCEHLETAAGQEVDGRLVVVDGEGSMPGTWIADRWWRAEVGLGRDLDEVDLTRAGVEPCTAEPEDVRAFDLGEAEDIGAETARPPEVANRNDV